MVVMVQLCHEHVILAMERAPHWPSATLRLFTPWWDCS